MKELDVVTLPDGHTGTILESFNGGEAFLVEFETPEGPHRYDDDFFKAEELRLSEAR